MNGERKVLVSTMIDGLVDSILILFVLYHYGAVLMDSGLGLLVGGFALYAVKGFVQALIAANKLRRML